jgi:hypothetical protein
MFCQRNTEKRWEVNYLAFPNFGGYFETDLIAKSEQNHAFRMGSKYSKSVHTIVIWNWHRNTRKRRKWSKVVMPLLGRLVASEARTPARASRRGICGGWNGTGTGFSHTVSSFLCQYRLPMLHSHSFFYRLRYTCATVCILKKNMEKEASRKAGL